MIERDGLLYPEESDFLRGEVFSGLGDGNLEPLAKYLRLGFPIDDGLRGLLAECIDGAPWCRFKLVMKGQKPGQVKQTDDEERDMRNLSIGIHAERLLRCARRGEFDAVIKETAEHFGVGSSVVTNALAVTRRQLAGDFTDPVALVDLVTLGLAFPGSNSSP